MPLQLLFARVIKRISILLNDCSDIKASADISVTGVRSTTSCGQDPSVTTSTFRINTRLGARFLSGACGEGYSSGQWHRRIPQKQVRNSISSVCYVRRSSTT
jgi:hypothetical protein